MHPIKIESVSQLLEHIDLVPSDEPEYIYRGESQAYTKPCTPSLFRNFRPTDGIEFDGGVNQEYLRVKRWREEVELLEGTYLQCRTNLEMMILARHYGLHTRLLDWSSNPLVSLWFSSNDTPDYNGHIYAHQNTSLSTEFPSEIIETEQPSDRLIALEKNPFCRKLPESTSHNTPALHPFRKVHFFRPRSLPSTRVLSQSGFISIHPNPDSSNEYCPFLKFEIPANRKKNIICELAVLGINERSLGLCTRDGIAKRLNDSRYPWV